MKIAFRGFRGFGPDTDFIDIKDLTILTGKNGSGKSTFLKLFILFSKFVDSTSSISQLVGRSIEIDNEIMGGKDNLLQNNSNVYPSIILKKRFEFYTDEHEIHFTFECQDYRLQLIKLAIINPKTKKNLLRWEPTQLIVDTIALNNQYKLAAKNYNICSEYLLYKSNNESIEGLNYDFNYYVEKTEDIETILNETLPYHLDPIHSDSNLSEILVPCADGEEPFPFCMKEYLNISQKVPHIILNIPTDSIEVTPHEVEDLFKNYEENYLIEADLQENTGYLYELLAKRVNLEITHLILSPNSLYYGEFDQIFIREEFFNEQKDNVDIGFEEVEDNFTVNDVVKYLIRCKSSLWTQLIRRSHYIFQKEIIADLNVISYLYTQSGVRNSAYRSYNLFNNENAFSHFLKHYNSLNQDQKDEIRNFISDKLCKLEIAQEIIVEIKDTIGFIYLQKNNNRIPLIDDGSGINNLVSLLLFLSSNLVFYDVEDCEYTDEKVKILILEEPESNLHPLLQSKMADIIAEFVWNSFSMVIVETHSEYLIRKLQYLVGKKKFLADKIALYYFDFDQFHGSREISFYPIEIKENGTLSREFGPGFLDEADNLSIDLFTLLQSQNN